ncbi:mitochondrial cardiolipin hydrolase-like [Agrilus planipennis]|uniref:Mitochondrial cardiolipin hydrolase n=1 Tax=Agrilus planipennis TaxID=224129 RepID=A0A1W4WK87_AGRPL|nr:mitochondrial cardiolipin hydrolase-like [Agrilus planipennis]
MACILKLWYGASVIISLSTWSFFIWCLLQKRQKWKQNRLFYMRHNCVVTYSRGKRMTGWPTDNKLVKNLVSNINIHFEPICYFISTAKTRLDIAVMALTINTIGEALLSANDRGVQIRIIVDFLCAKGNSLIKKIETSGIKVNYYVPSIKERESIMHYKYMVKDYVEDIEGFISAGSMNWTITGLFNNYENIVFSSDLNFAKALHNNFEHTWDFIEFSKLSYDVKAKLNLLK